MIKRAGFIGITFVFSLALALIFLPVALADQSTFCSATPRLISQDPYPASPGEYVKLVFQIDGVSNANCKTVSFELKDQFPIKFDPAANHTYSFESGIFQRTYADFAIAPFKVRIDPDAIRGDNDIEAVLSYGENAAMGMVYNFTVGIEDLRSNFDIYVKNYDLTTNTLTLEMINIGKTNLKALTVTILPESYVTVKGASKSAVGDLDTSEYTTTDFEVSGSGDINLKLEYTDETNTRREMFSTVSFDPSYFEGRKKDEKTTPTWNYIIAGIVALLILYWIFKKIKKFFKK